MHNYEKNSQFEVIFTYFVKAGSEVDGADNDAGGDYFHDELKQMMIRRRQMTHGNLIGTKIEKKNLRKV